MKKPHIPPARIAILLISVLIAVAPVVYIHTARDETENKYDDGTNDTAKSPARGGQSSLRARMQPINQRGKCETMLDQLEAKFDARRQTRLDSAKQLRSQLGMDALYYFDPFEPEATCFPEERFGGQQRYYAIFDGPKFVCGTDFMEKNNCLVYSVGSYNSISFEQAIHTNFGCETHTFDPTLTETFKGGKYATFHPWGLGLDNVNQNFDGHHFVSKSLATIVKELGHEGRTLDILKIDCESCEWKTMIPVFQDIAKGTFKVNQIQIEMHYPPWPGVFDFFEAADSANMRVIHKERNHWGCRGYLCVEYAFVSNDFLRSVNSNVVCNHRLDRTSNTQACHDVLDELFDRFADTRKMRNDFIAAGYNQSVTRVPFINHFFDPFESEALCFAKERLGSNSNNHKLGFGGKFTCGIDFIENDVCNIYSYSADQSKSFEDGIKSQLNCFQELSADEATTSLVQTIQKKSTSGRVDIVNLENVSRRALINLFDGITKGQIVVNQLLVKLDSSGDFSALAEVFQSADKAGMLIVHKEYVHWQRVREENDENKSFQFTFVRDSHLRLINSRIACSNELMALS